MVRDSSHRLRDAVFTNEVIRGLLSQSLKTASLENGAWKDSGEGPGSHAGDFIEWLTIRNQEESVLADVERIKSHPLVPKDIPVYGYVYDVKSGKLIEVKQANVAGASGR